MQGILGIFRSRAAAEKAVLGLLATRITRRGNGRADVALHRPCCGWDAMGDRLVRVDLR